MVGSFVVYVGFIVAMVSAGVVVVDLGLVFLGCRFLVVESCSEEMGHFVFGSNLVARRPCFAFELEVFDFGF